MKAADYKIKVSTGEIPLLFINKTFRSYTLKKGIEMEDLDAGIRGGQGLKANDIPLFLLTAHEVWCVYNNTECIYTELDADLWVDDIGGWRSNEMGEIYKIFVRNFFNMDEGQFELLWNTVITDSEKPIEKKKGKVKNLHGEDSTNMQRKLV